MAGRHGVRESSQAVDRQVVLHQRVVHEGQDQRVPLQDLEERLVRAPPEVAVRLVGQRQDLAQREPLLPAVAPEGERQAAGQLREQAAEGARAGVVPLVQEALLRLRQGVRAHLPRLPEKVPIAGQGGVVEERRGRVVRDLQPFQLEEEHQVPDLRQVLLDPLPQVPELRPAGVRRVQETGEGADALQVGLDPSRSPGSPPGGGPARGRRGRGWSRDTARRTARRGPGRSRQVVLDGRVVVGGEQVAQIPPDAGRGSSLVAHGWLLSADGEAGARRPPTASDSTRETPERQPRRGGRAKGVSAVRSGVLCSAAWVTGPPTRGESWTPSPNRCRASCRRSADRSPEPRRPPAVAPRAAGSRLPAGTGG